MKTTEAREIPVDSTFVFNDELWFRVPDADDESTDVIAARRIAVLSGGVWKFYRVAEIERFNAYAEVDLIQFTALDGADERLLEVKCTTHVFEHIRATSCCTKRQLCAELFNQIPGVDTDNVSRLADKAVSELLRRGLITRDHFDDGDMCYQLA